FGSVGHAGQRVGRENCKSFDFGQPLVARGSGGQRLADDDALEAGIQPAKTTRSAHPRSADLVATSPELAEGAVARQAHEVIAGVGALVHLAPLQAMALAP